MAENKKVVECELPPDECECASCVIRDEAGQYLSDTIAALSMLYARKYEVTEEHAFSSVLSGVMDAFAELVITPLAGDPDIEDLMEDILGDLHTRMQEVREDAIQDEAEADDEKASQAVN